MTTTEIQQGALNLPEDQRAMLITDLMDSLPVVLSDVDDGSAEARRRLAELKADPSTGRSWAEIKSGLGR
jgi:putative addiction module component (TIGR02574 family)